MTRFYLCRDADTELQVKWAASIEVHMRAHFGVSNDFESIARKQDAAAQINSPTMRSIFEDKPAGVAEDESGYLIHEWQALRDKARRMII
jgi:hypothetical protein